jgi:hypothetical protein
VDKQIMDFKVRPVDAAPGKQEKSKPPIAEP